MFARCVQIEAADMSVVSTGNAMALLQSAVAGQCNTHVTTPYRVPLIYSHIAEMPWPCCNWPLQVSVTLSELLCTESL